VGRWLTLNEALVGGPSDRDREACDRPSKQPDPVPVVRMGKRGKPLAIRLSRALTSEVKGDERVVGLHES
jgi:hypothetical protein